MLPALITDTCDGCVIMNEEAETTTTSRLSPVEQQLDLVRNEAKLVRTFVNKEKARAGKQEKKNDAEMFCEEERMQWVWRQREKITPRDHDMKQADLPTHSAHQHQWRPRHETSSWV